jgi:hypothetical protein
MVLTDPGETRMGHGVAQIYDVYGLAEATLGGEPTRLAEALEIEWETRDSDYRGRYFQSPGPPNSGGRLLLQANDLRDDSGGYLQVPDFPEFRYLLFVDEAAQPDEVRARLAGLPQWKFLRRRELD